MGLGLRLFVLLLSLLALISLGTIIFTKGFLLKRTVVNKTSECSVDFTIQSERHGEEGCWMHRRYRKAVLIVIDALRYDFMLFNSSLADDTAQYFENKLPVLYELLQRKPLNSRLYKFVADPPTTTLQRLKGLTTGSLPTFVDAGSNFASYEITEDNVIDQLRKLNKRITFMGDDTWMGLFPGRFQRSFPFPSFDVMDLHTVDHGILEHLLPELRRSDWDVAIAHFLGVDHCGHRFGPSHIEMSKKLRQMDIMLRSIVEQMEEDTVLFVMGDHGMTRTGDHGGDSQSELEAGLFIYSPAQITATPLPKDPSQYGTVSQIDLVPTLSLLLGVPIPFSNLGTVMMELFNHCPWWKTGNSKIKQTYHSLKALRLNAYQVNGYLEAYKPLAGDLDVGQLEKLQKLFIHSEADLQNLLTAMVKNNDNRDVERRMQILEDHYFTYLMELNHCAEKTWAKFDMGSVYLGLTVVFVSVAGTVALLVLTNTGQETVSWKMYLCVGGCLVITVFGVVQKSYMSNSSMPFILGTFDLLVFVFMVFAVMNMSQKKKEGHTDSDSGKMADIVKLPKLDTLISCVVCFLTFVSYFSNSFVVYEDKLMTFLTQTLLVVLSFFAAADIFYREKAADIDRREKSGPQKRPHNFDVIKLLTHPSCMTLILAVLMMICVRASSVFHACREEQVNCEISAFLEPLSESNSRNARYMFSIACLVITVFSSRLWLRHFGNLNGNSFPVLCARYAIPAAAVCLALHWALTGLPAKILDSLEPWQQVALPRAAYFLLGLCLVAILFSPLCIYKLPTTNDHEFQLYPGLSRNQIIPSLFSHVKQNFRQQLANQKSEDKPPVVYGLGSMYSASIVFLVTVCCLLISLLLGDGMSPSVFLMLLVQFLYLELCAQLYGHKSSEGVSIFMLPVIGWGLLTSLFFYNSGHQATVTTIRWEVAFTGFHGNHESNIVPAVLVALNTFSSYILFTVASPLLLFSQRVRTGLITVFSKAKLDVPEKGDFSLNEEPAVLRTAIFRLFLSIILFQCLKLFASMCAAALHRRHLMVWKIFAPRFVFEATSSFLVFELCSLMYLFVLRVDSALNRWVSCLAETQKTK
ncbi:LOW QUALITY PROTEIN: GPI ethanolamine phosphate transferase 3-like [Liolophura sinensis]|uniref:LOW QUALITY PROTEIN: GPI ethanolamine phosphate transferase 3-like n=1 Tax=Liolophura sinensis TaxID=3198878 RepID=UPI0031598ED8